MRLLLFLLIATPAIADPIVPIAQIRSVECSAYVEDFASAPVDDRDTASAADFAAFDIAISADASNGSALGDSGAIQRSTIGANVITATGSFFGTAESYDFGGYASSSGAFHFEVDFELTRAQYFRLSGMLGAFDNGSVVVELIGPGGSLYFDAANGPSQTRDFVESGNLAAGSYKLRVAGGGSADAVDFDFVYGSGDYDVSFVVGAEGPGGEVQPLRFDKLGNGLPELSWNLSCRPDDVDYTVYEGVLGQPTSTMQPIACTTGGTRSRIVIGAASTYYLVVPHDGATEGSYGAMSDGTERFRSLTACRPQQLAGPICP